MVDRMITLSVMTTEPEEHFQTFRYITNAATQLAHGSPHVSVSSVILDNEPPASEPEQSEDLYYDEFTLVKVRQALRSTLANLGILDPEIDVLVTEAISAMQNEGILFRERPKD